LEDTIRIDELIQCASNLQQPANIPQPVTPLGRYMLKASKITAEQLGSECDPEEVSVQNNSESPDASSSSLSGMKDNKRMRFASKRRGEISGVVEASSANITLVSSETEEIKSLAAAAEEAVQVASADKQAVGVCYSLAQLTDNKVWRTLPDVAPTQREKYLSPRDFQEVFRMSKEEFEKLPRWKRDWMKQSRALF